MKLKFLSLFIFVLLFYSTTNCVLVINNSNYEIKIAVKDTEPTIPDNLFFSKIGTSMLNFFFERDLESYETITLKANTQQDIDVLIYKENQLLISIDNETPQRYLITDNNEDINSTRNLEKIIITNNSEEEEEEEEESSYKIIIQFVFDKSNDSDGDSYYSSSVQESDTDKSKEYEEYIEEKVNNKNYKNKAQNNKRFSVLSSLSEKENDEINHIEIDSFEIRNKEKNKASNSTKIKISYKEDEKSDSTTKDEKRQTSEKKIERLVKTGKNFFTIKKIALVLGLGIATWYMYNHLSKNFKKKKNT